MVKPWTTYKPEIVHAKIRRIMTKPKKQLHPYYDWGRVLSHVAIYCFIVGARGLGKTHGAKKSAVKNALEKGHQFIYVRRYKTELTPSRNTFFADIEHYFPEWEFRTHGGMAQATEFVDPALFETEAEYKKAIKGRTWITIGYFVALSTAQTQKSVSYPQVRVIIFDEFIIEKGAFHYLPNEADVFNNFYSTVDRGRKENEVRVYFLANSVSIMNPYFMAYKIRPDQLPEFSTSHNNFILCHFPDSAHFAESVYETRFGKFIQGTEYADYAIGNTFRDSHEELLGGKPSHADYIFTLETSQGTFSIWYDQRKAEYYAQRKRPKGNESVYTLVPEKMSSDKILMTFQDKPLSILRTCFRQGKVHFDEPETRNAFIEIFRR